MREGSPNKPLLFDYHVFLVAFDKSLKKSVVIDYDNKNSLHSTFEQYKEKVFKKRIIYEISY